MEKEYFVFFKDLVTQAKDGIMRKEDKKKLDGIDEGANKIIVDSVLSKTSQNPVQNKVIATEIETLKKSGSDSKKNVANAITGMGVTTATDADFDTITGNIEKIGGDTTISAGDVLSGKVAYAKGKYITGSMPNNGAKTAALDCGESYNIPSGYHNGAGRVSANSLASQTGATAAASDILSGKTAYVNGSKITGNIPSKAAAIYTPGTTNQEIAAGQYLSGKQTIKGDANLLAANIKKGISIFGVTGNLEANKQQVTIGSAILSRFSKLVEFDISLWDYKNHLSNSYYSNWYSCLNFEIGNAYGGSNADLYPDGANGKLLETFLLFETGECLHLYFRSSYNGNLTEYSYHSEWITAQPTSFSIKIFNGTTDEMINRASVTDDFYNSASNIFTINMRALASKRIKFYAIPIAFKGPSYVAP